jgi:diaminopimelate decarboxylase
VLALLAREGSGADVVSEGEIRAVLAAGIPASKIVFSGVGKQKREMAYALEQQIFQFNVESEPELEALNEVAISKGVRAPIAIRINPDVDPRTHAKISTGKKETKFGVEMDVALRLYDRARDMQGIVVQGVSVHIGSQLLDLAPFREAFIITRQFVEDLRARGHRITTLDLGGGFGIRYQEDTSAPQLADYAAIVRETMQGIDATLLFEPGRVLVGNAGVLVTRVIYVKEGTSRRFMIVDAGMNDLIRPTLYGAYHEILPVIEPSQGAEQLPYDVVGPVCETGDIFAEQRLLPPVKAGDLWVFRSAGAYGAVMANSYNARPLIQEVMV